MRRTDLMLNKRGKVVSTLVLRGERALWVVAIGVLEVNLVTRA